jgi:hypothetical protein
LSLEAQAEAWVLNLLAAEAEALVDCKQALYFWVA